MIFHIPFYLSAIFEVIFSIYHKVLKVYLKSDYLIATSQYRLT